MGNFVRLRERVLNSPLLITESYAHVLIGALSDRMDIASLNIDGDDYEVSDLKEEARLYTSNGNAMERKPYQVLNGTAIIPVKGTLVHKTGYLRPYSGMTGYDGIRANFDMALNDSDVKEIMFDMNSPGGEVSGCFELSDYIYENRGDKRITALVDDMACSACYALASAADIIVGGDLSNTGSIGVITGHISRSDQLKEDGIKVTLITAGKHKADGNPYQDLPEEVRASMQERVDKIYGKFVDTVARNRGLSVDAVKSTEASTYFGADALSIGLIDRVESTIDYVHSMSSSGGSNTNVKMESSEMSQETETNQELDTAVAAATTAERDRISAILNSEQAEGRAKMANHLAFKTNMTVEQANAMLEVAAKEVAETPTQAVKIEADSTGFQEALAQASAEEVGFDASGEAAESDEIGDMLALVGAKDLAKVGA